MADVVLSTVDLDVFGGPSSVEVSVDFGATGQRGSRIWAGPGSAETYLVGQDIKLYDWYIDTTTSKMYQFTEQPGSPVWTFILSLPLPQKIFITSATFTAGSATITIPISEFTSADATGVSATNFVVNYNISNSTEPVSSSFTISKVGTDISIVISAIKYSAGSWSNLTGSKSVHMLISYVG